MLIIDEALHAKDLMPQLEAFWRLTANKILAVDAGYQPADGSPVFTRGGKYTSQGWTEWTQGFQFGSALLQFDATGEERFLEIGRRRTWDHMAPHVSHFGVHDHGFNNVSTYGNLWRLAREGRVPISDAECALYELALKVSGAVQARRWTRTADGSGFIYSFNGPHSLFCDTIRSLRSLAVAHHLGHRLLDENDRPISLLKRLCDHARTTARFNVYYGEGRDIYDVWGRVAHESIFNTNDGNYRNPSTQQGYSPFTTWTRGLAWIITGFAEQLEFLAAREASELLEHGVPPDNEAMFRRAAQAAADFYIANVATDGIPYWDTGAPGLAKIPDCLNVAADPACPYEPVDSSAAAIAAQGLIRLGRYLEKMGDAAAGARYGQAGLTVFRTLLSDNYLARDPAHEGILLHAVYHRPRGWDAVPAGATVPRGEACMWGDYHLLELALLVQRLAQGHYHTFFAG